MNLPVLPDLPSTETTYDDEGYAIAEERGGRGELDALGSSGQPAEIHREGKPDNAGVRDSKYRILPYSGEVRKIDTSVSSQKMKYENATNGKQAVGTNDDAGGVKETEGVAKKVESLSHLPPLERSRPDKPFGFDAELGKQ